MSASEVGGGARLRGLAVKASKALTMCQAPSKALHSPHLLEAFQQPPSWELVLSRFTDERVEA